MKTTCKICLGEHPGALCPMVKEIMMVPGLDMIEFDAYGRIKTIRFKNDARHTSVDSPDL